MLRATLGLALVLCALGACSEDKSTASLDAARQLTAEMQLGGDLNLSKPASLAKRSSDLLAVLDRPGRPEAHVQADIEAADAQPPADLSPQKRAAFLYNRSFAAERLGRSAQRLTDIKEAVRLRGGLGPDGVVHGEKLPADYVVQLAYAELEASQLRLGRDLLLQAAARYERLKTVAGRVLGLYANIAHYSANLREFDQAEAALRKGEAVREALLKDPRDEQVAKTFAPDWEASLLQGRYWIAFARGEWTTAEGIDRQRLQLYEAMQAAATADPSLKSDYRGMISGRHQELAVVLREEGRLAEAEAEILTALDSRLAYSGRYQDATAGVLVDWASILYYERRYQDRVRVLRAAVETYEKSGYDDRSLPLANVRAAYGGALIAADRVGEGIALVERARATYAAVSPDRLATHPSILDYGLALAQQGRTADAVDVLSATIADRARRLGPNAFATRFARLALAQAQAETGLTREAIQGFHANLPVLFSGRREVDEETGQSTYDTNRQGFTFSYFWALAKASNDRTMALDFDPVAEAFAFSEEERATGAARALTASTARNAIDDPKMAELARSEQNARVEQSRLSRQLAAMQAVAPKDRDTGGIAKVRDRLGKIAAARAVLQAEIAGQESSGRSAEPARVTLESARQALRDDEALVAVQVLRNSLFQTSIERLYIWAFRKTGPVAFKAVEVPRGALGVQIRQLRKAVDADIETVQDIPAFDTQLAHRLYSEFLEPVADGWRGARTLIVVSERVISELPFHLLVTAPYRLPAADKHVLFDRYADVPWLARGVAVAELPSATSLIQLRQVPPPPKESRDAFAGFGDPWFTAHDATQAPEIEQAAAVTVRGGRIKLRAVRRAVDGRSFDQLQPAEHLLSELAPLPETADEIRAVAATLGADAKKDVFLGAAATEQAVRTMDLSHKRVIMFATHGLVPGDLPGLTQPALALSVSGVAGTAGDGLLTLDKILNLRLNADWVVLSACNTASGDGQGGSAVSGLGRAFFYAGARALLVTNWAVETNAARQLTTATFQFEAQRPDLGRAEALRRAMIELIDGPGYMDAATGRPVFSYAHPLFWAPYSLVGEPAPALP